MSRVPEHDAFSRTEDCLTLEEVVGLSDNALDGDVKDRAAAHLRSCARCQAELAIFEEFRAAEVRPGEAADVTYVVTELQRRSPMARKHGEERVASRFWPAWMSGWLRPAAGVLAALIIVAGAGVYLRKSGPPRIDTSGVDRGMLRSGRIVLLSPGEITKGVPREFRWEDVEGVRSYRVRLFQIDRTELWKVESQKNSVPLPESVSNTISPPTSLFWSVEAVDDEGRVVVKSNLQRIHITR